ncbi:MAG: RagB/SusD family nutrient uptake outer membrane protein [Prevotella sp.]|nr:RagB/SusD family nutrient uptake outer membrane protein [Prevotella sp.]MCI1548506.1 RagB/SusD family nutrient uptake outer membrane protein [Prevotella sp.]MCI1596411.1 RagB/SusD family nutrient uptake outer membrane protein [Prevotella sp.]
MKSNKIVTMALLFGTMFGAMTSCSDSFLDEKMITNQTTDHYKTQAGLDELVTGAYTKLKFKFNYIWGIECYNMGTDEFTSGANNITGWNAYSTSLNSTETGANQPMWDNMYGLIEPCNILIQNIPQYYSKASDTYNTRLGEAYFLRAYGYFELVKQFGGVPLKLTPSTSVETTFTRNSEEECYNQIIKDFETAYSLLPETASQTGRITKSAAAHFLAKAHLFRASELYDSWNSKYKDADLDAVIQYGKEVIAAHPLCKDFADLWDYQKANGDNEKVSEVVLAAQFSDDASTWGRYGNQMHLYYPSVYQNLSGCIRDISGDREFSYVSATEYAMQVFDRVDDSRFWKSFVTTYNCNLSSGAPEYSAEDVADGVTPAGVKAGDKRFAAGDIGIKYIVNNPGDSRFTDENGKKSDLGVLEDGKLLPQHTFIRYYKGEKFSWNIDKSQTTGNYYDLMPAINRSVALSKFRDGYRNSYNSQFGTRDAIIARSADDVLMVAEAYARKGDYSDAITYLNMVRDRAGYAAGENREKHVDGGQAYRNNPYCSGGTAGRPGTESAIYCDSSTYYESNDIPRTVASTKSAMHLNSVDDILNSAPDMPVYQALDCTTTAQKVMCFILDERTRELIGESQRWEDLARTKTLGARWEAFNCASTLGQGTFDPAKNYYRPIPQSFLDGITNSDGSTLTAKQKEALQNPGY